MKTRITKQLLFVILFPLFSLFAGFHDEEVSRFLAHKGINFVESDIFYSKEDILTVVGSFGISSNSISFHEPWGEIGCPSCKCALTIDERQITMEAFLAGTAAFAQRTMIKKLLTTSMPMELILQRYVRGHEFGDILLYATYDHRNGKSIVADGNCVAFSRGNAAFILRAHDRGVSVLDFAHNLDTKLIASDTASPLRCAISKKRKNFTENLLKMPKPLTDSIETKFTNEPLCEKLEAYNGEEIQFTNVNPYGESVLAEIRTSKDEQFSLQILSSSFWNNAIESIANSILAMGFSEEEASRRITTRNTMNFYQIFLDRESPRMWTFHYAGRFIAILQPSQKNGNGAKDVYTDMNKISEILDGLLLDCEEHSFIGGGNAIKR